MGILRDKTIDTKNLKPSDNYIKNITGSSLSIQIDGNASLSMKGAHSNFNTDKSYTVGMINMTSFDKITVANTPGLYLVIVEGIDEMELEISGEGTIHWKELGD